MPAELLRVDPTTPAADAIAYAAQKLRSGGLVAFPTETVYGLGANALEETAVARIFAAKGRPATNPIIVHIASIGDARKLTSAWPATAQQLAERFWPGPLTLVLPKDTGVPDLVTAGGPTVALRMPAHPVALALLRACSLPLAAPSANRSGEISPTLAEHVLRGLADRVDLVLDAGPTSGGLESTVLDLTTLPPRLLRPGLLTVMQLESVLGPIELGATMTNEPLRAPGQLARHYAPRTPTTVVRDSQRVVAELCQRGLRVGCLTHLDAPTSAVMHIVLPANAPAYASQLYAALHTLDAAGLDRIVIEAPPDDDAWLAVRDRLRRAATA